MHSFFAKKSVLWVCMPHCLAIARGDAANPQGLELAVPGTYTATEAVVTIAAFAPQLHVITSKQRPRKLTIHGSDGAEYMFLLKVGTLAEQEGFSALLYLLSG